MLTAQAANCHCLHTWAGVPARPCWLLPEVWVLQIQVRILGPEQPYLLPRWTLPCPIWNLELKHIFWHVFCVSDSSRNLGPCGTATTSVGLSFGKRASFAPFPSSTPAPNASHHLPPHTSTPGAFFTPTQPQFSRSSTLPPPNPAFCISHSSQVLSRTLPSPSHLSWLVHKSADTSSVHSPPHGDPTWSLSGPLPLLYS